MELISAIVIYFYTLKKLPAGQNFTKDKAYTVGYNLDKWDPGNIHLCILKKTCVLFLVVNADANPNPTAEYIFDFQLREHIYSTDGPHNLEQSAVLKKKPWLQPLKLINKPYSPANWEKLQVETFVIPLLLVFQNLARLSV